jgi:hypothetical protein
MLWLVAGTAQASTDTGVYAFATVPMELSGPAQNARPHTATRVDAASVHLRTARIETTTGGDGPTMRALLAPLGAAFALVAPLLLRRRRGAPFAGLGGL